VTPAQLRLHLDSQTVRLATVNEPLIAPSKPASHWMFHWVPSTLVVLPAVHVGVGTTEADEVEEIVAEDTDVELSLEVGGLTRLEELLDVAMDEERLIELVDNVLDKERLIELIDDVLDDEEVVDESLDEETLIELVDDVLDTEEVVEETLVLNTEEVVDERLDEETEEIPVCEAGIEVIEEVAEDVEEESEVVLPEAALIHLQDFETLAMERPLTGLIFSESLGLDLLLVRLSHVTQTT